MSIFTKIGLFLAHVFSQLFKASQAAYEKLTPEQQLALQQGAGFVEIIKSMLAGTPQEIRAALQQKFPTMDEASLEQALFKVANAFGFVPTSLEEAIALIQGHISKQPASDTGEVILHTAASAFAFFVAPPGTKFAIIASLMEWVYQHFFKKSIDPVASN